MTRDWRLAVPGCFRLSAAVLSLPLWIFAPHAQAQASQLKDLMDLALTRHPTITQARSQAQAAGFELEAAKWGRFPSVSTELRSDSAYVQSLAKVEQPLWAGGRIDARIALSQAGQRVADAGLREAQLTALMQVATAFFESLRLQSRLKMAEDNVLEHKRLQEMIGRRISAQVSPPADGTLAQARFQQALSEQLQIQRQLDTNRNLLTQWAGPIAGKLVPPRSIDYVKARSSGDALEQVRAVSGQRLKLQAQIDTAIAQIDVAKSQSMPTVVAGVQHLIQGPTVVGADRTRAYLGLQYQPGAGLSSIAGIQSAIARKDAAEQELLVLERSLENQVANTYSEIEALQNQLAPAQQLAQGTDDLVGSYLRQYQVGRKNWLDVLNALREKTQALYNLTDVQHSLMLAQVRMLLLTGQVHGQNLTLIHD